MIKRLSGLAQRFASEKNGSVAVNFAITALPLVLVTGFAVDYGVMSRHASQLQVAVDSAALNAASQSTNRETIAKAVFAAALAQHGPTGAANATGADKGAGYQVSGTITVDTMVMQIAGIKRVTITRRATAAYAQPAIPGQTDNSCIFTLGEGLDVSADATTFNGSPSVNLSGCTIRSNKSMKCNGHDTGVQASYAVGTIVGCANPNPGVDPVPDTFAADASNIEKKCGTSSVGATWNANGAIPTNGNVIVETKTAPDGSTYKQVNVCGNLTLSGTGTLTGLNPAEDTVVIVENGQINLSDNSVIDAKRVGLVLAGGNGADPVIDFPNGNGKAAVINVSAGTNKQSPWGGYAIYQDPALTGNVDMTFKPGSNVTVDGIAYFPKAKITVQGNMSVGSSGCAKIVSSEFVLNGTVNLQQSAASCEQMAVTQYQAPGTDASFAYLTE